MTTVENKWSRQCCCIWCMVGMMGSAVSTFCLMYVSDKYKGKLKSGLACVARLADRTFYGRSATGSSSDRSASPDRRIHTGRNDEDSSFLLSGSCGIYIYYVFL